MPMSNGRMTRFVGLKSRSRPTIFPALRLMRERAPEQMDIAAGEYIYTLDDARRMLEAGAVDVLQADASRCGGITGFVPNRRPL